jgi:hypothetical protein
MRAAFGLLLVACLCEAAAAQSETLVGDLGDAERLVIEGTSTFSADEIRDGLFLVPDLHLAADPSAPLDKYLLTIERLIAAGYRHAGFHNVEVIARPDSKTHAIKAHVTEGDRYYAGEVRVRGNKEIRIEQLVARLTKPYPPKDATVLSPVVRQGKVEMQWADSDGKVIKQSQPVWQTGKPAHLLTVPEAESQLHQDVADAISDLGYRWAKFSVDVVAHASTKKADLVVDISDEGGRSVFSSVNVAGNEANTRDDIVKYIEFKPGTPATREEQIRVQSKLWQSGRFIKSEVTIYQPATLADNASLQIKLLELHGLPPVNKPLLPEDEVFLKCRDWLVDYGRWEGDLVLKCDASEGSGCVVFSPTEGVFTHFKFNDGPGQKRSDFVAVASASEVAFYNLLAGRNVTMPAPERKLIGSVALQLTDAANDKTSQPHKLMFGIGVNSERVKTKSPLDMTLSAAPVYFLEMARDPDGKCSIKDGVLTLVATTPSGHDTGKKTARIDVATGKLLDYVEDWVCEETSGNNPTAEKAGSPESAHAETASRKSHATIRLSMVRGEFRRRLDEVHTSTGNRPNAYDSRHPLSSLLAFGCQEELIWQWYDEADKCKQARPVVQRMAEKGVFEPLDRMLIDLCAEGGQDSDGMDDAFSVPDVTRTANGSRSEIAAIGACVSWLTHGLFLPGSWPESIGRDALLAVSGNGEAAGVELMRLYKSDKNGPLCYLTVTELLSRFNPPMAQMMASRGLQRLSLQDFRKEYAVFLNPRCPMGQFAIKVAEFLRETDDGDVQAIAAMLPDVAGKRLQQSVANLRRNRSQPPEQTLPALLDDLWQNGLRERVKAALESLEIATRPYIQQSNNGKTPDVAGRAS